MNEGICGLALLSLLPALAGADEIPFTGLWGGRAHTAEETTRIEIDVARGDEGWRARMNLLDVGVRGWPAESVDAAADRLTVIVRADSGAQTLSLRYEDGRLLGDLAQLVNLRHHACRALGIAGAVPAAVECLQSAFEEPSRAMPFIEPLLPYYDSMRDDPGGPYSTQ